MGIFFRNGLVKVKHLDILQFNDVTPLILDGFCITNFFCSFNVDLMLGLISPLIGCF